MYEFIWYKSQNQLQLDAVSCKVAPKLYFMVDLSDLYQAAGGLINWLFRIYIIQFVLDKAACIVLPLDLWI